MRSLERAVYFASLGFVAWFLMVKLVGLEWGRELPLAFIAIFLWGTHILIQYFTKVEMHIAVGLHAPAGDLDVPTRKRGAFFGALLCFLMVYGFLTGWSS